jgi:hypothetical protein
MGERSVSVYAHALIASNMYSIKLFWSVVQ